MVYKVTDHLLNWKSNPSIVVPAAVSVTVVSALSGGRGWASLHVTNTCLVHKYILHISDYLIPTVQVNLDTFVCIVT